MGTIQGISDMITNIGSMILGVGGKPKINQCFACKTGQDCNNGQGSCFQK